MSIPSPSLSSSSITAPDSTDRATTGSAQITTKRLRSASEDERFLLEGGTGGIGEVGYGGGGGGDECFTVESEQELDERLGEELDVDQGLLNKQTTATAATTTTTTPITSEDMMILPDMVKSSSPIPLLTPPESPVQSSSLIVEWPSNLVVDSALNLVVASNFRPLSPASLVEDEQQREEETSSDNDLKANISQQQHKQQQLQQQQKEDHNLLMGGEGCSLTRRLSFIRVGED